MVKDAVVPDAIVMVPELPLKVKGLEEVTV